MNDLPSNRRDGASKKVDPRPPVGIIGIGLMGLAIAERLIAGGVRVVGMDINPQRCSLLRNAGGETVADVSSVALTCDQVLLSLPDSSVVEQTLAAIADCLRPKQSILIDTTTGDPVRAGVTGERLDQRGIAYLDATVSGSSAQVRAGEVTVMVGGNEIALGRCRSLFDLFARGAFHVGPCGSGSIMKLVTNLVLGLNRAALAEGLAFARGMGIAPARALGVLRESMAYSRIIDTKGEKMVSGDFEAQARLSQHLKDVRLILQAGLGSGVSLPLSTTHRELLEAAEAAGLGQLDNSAIIRVFEQLANPISDPQ